MNSEGFTSQFYLSRLPGRKESRPDSQLGVQSIEFQRCCLCPQLSLWPQIFKRLPIPWLQLWEVKWLQASSFLCLFAAVSDRFSSLSPAPHCSELNLLECCIGVLKDSLIAQAVSSFWGGGANPSRGQYSAHYCGLYDEIQHDIS